MELMYYAREWFAMNGLLVIIPLFLIIIVAIGTTMGEAKREKESREVKTALEEMIRKVVKEELGLLGGSYEIRNK